MLRGHGPFESAENAKLVLGGDANPVIPHMNCSLLALDRDHEKNGLAGSVDERISKEVGEHLLNAKRIPPDGDHGGSPGEIPESCGFGVKRIAA